MDILSRQIEAVKESLRQVMAEWENDETHAFLTSECPLCQEFFKEGRRCENCPINCFEGEFHGCSGFVKEVNEKDWEDIAGFLKSLEISLGEMR